MGRTHEALLKAEKELEKKQGEIIATLKKENPAVCGYWEYDSQNEKNNEGKIFIALQRDCKDRNEIFVIIENEDAREGLIHYINRFYGEE